MTTADAWNEDGVPGEDDVAGLAFEVAKEWGWSVSQAFQDDRSVPSRRALAPEMYCSSCQAVNTSRFVGKGGEVMFSRLPWVSWNGDAETTFDQSGDASSTEGNQ